MPKRRRPTPPMPTGVVGPTPPGILVGGHLGRVELRRHLGSWLRLEVEDETVMLTQQSGRHAVLDIIPMASVDMHVLTAAWLAWHGLEAVPITPSPRRRVAARGAGPSPTEAPELLHGAGHAPPRVLPPARCEYDSE